MTHIRISRIPAALSLLLCLTSCEWFKGGDDEKGPNYETWKSVGYFGANLMNTYYLWEEEVGADIQEWMSRRGYLDPIETVADIRYKENGKDYDRWTEMFDDIESVEDTFQGVSTTYGCSIVLKMWSQDQVVAVITLVYPGSPAANAGLKRGDIVFTVDGKAMNTSNYYDLVTSHFLYSPSCRIGVSRTGSDIVNEVSMTAVTMYENPVVHHDVFDINGKKVGYLFYSSFTLRSIPDLIEVFRGFKAEGVKELIIDLRYNGGGYVTAEEVLASMIAPAKNVSAGDIFEISTYNETLTKAYMKQYGDDALNSRFTTSFTYEEDGQKYSYSTAGLNLGISKLYAIVDSGSASASESLLVGLMPYMDVVTIGGRTHGKFCSGITYSADDWYEEMSDYILSSIRKNAPLASGWGMYIMIGSYSDCNGDNPCRPNGLTPRYEAEDIPENGHAIGDPYEGMLRQALTLAGKTDWVRLESTAPAVQELPDMALQVESPVFGRRIISLK